MNVEKVRCQVRNCHNTRCVGFPVIYEGKCEMVFICTECLAKGVEAAISSHSPPKHKKRTPSIKLVGGKRESNQG